MAALNSGIEWTEATWNPVTGCSKVSAGCANCYAERMAKRLRLMGNPRYRNGFEVTLHHDQTDLPLRWRRPKTIFVNSMSDLFHEDVPEQFISAIFDTMKMASWHTFQVLTKRAQRLADLAPHLDWPENVWMGVTLERQDYADRVRLLKTTPARIKFLSCEPLLGPLDLNLEGIDWVIVGGESGPGARPMDLNWVRTIRNQCLAADVPLFLKQLGGVVDKRGKDQAMIDGLHWKGRPSQERDHVGILHSSR